ncbi:MAG: hypothetical protein LBO00_02260 [Zoogloeaceae bacterium]|jgi:hypothetical protein|nr:hypothetical protein [Zoogloeaceae bacterium]
MFQNSTRFAMTENFLPTEIIEGEIGLIIDYRAGQTPAIDVLSGAMRFIEALDVLDKALLSSVDTSLEPVSILNDVQRSSLKFLLARLEKRSRRRAQKPGMEKMGGESAGQGEIPALEADWRGHAGNCPRTGSPLHRLLASA